MTSMNERPVLQEIVVPPKPSPTADLERDADSAVRFLQLLSSSNRLDPELRMEMLTIQNTVKNLKTMVVRMREEAEVSHERLTEVVRSQRLTG